MTTNISFRRDSKSDHNKESKNIKSDVVETESSGSSSDFTHTTLFGGPVLSLINKQLRNYHKKLNQILQMEKRVVLGMPLNKEKEQLLRSKPAISAFIDELEKLRNLLASVVSEEISLALQCHAISGKNGTSQDQDQEKASEEKEFKAHKELSIDSRLDHSEGTTKIKSDVLVSIDSVGFSLGIIDTTVVIGPVLSLINKCLRNHRKKLNRILQMEEFLAQGKPLNREQVQLLQSKPAVSALIDELEKLRKPLASAVSEEIFLALQCHARTDLKQTDRKWKMRCKYYLEENSRLLLEKDVLELEFKRLNLSSLLHGIRKSLLSRWPKFNCDSDADQKEENSLIDQQNEEDQEEENSLIDQQNKEFSFAPWEVEVLGISDIDKMEEVDWERCCRELRASNMWVKEQLSVYKGQLEVMKNLAVKFPEVIGGKPADDTSLVSPY